MPHALRLPVELLHYISKCLDTTDLSSWSRSCRAFHATLTPLLYYNVKDNRIVMCWACDEGRLDTVQRLLDAGANPNVAWTQNKPRWWTLRAQHSQPSQPQTTEDLPATLQLGEDHPQLLHRQRGFRMDIARWLLTYARIEYDMAKYFDEDYYEVDDYSMHGELDVMGNHAIGWAELTHPKTFPQRCYWTPLHIAAAWGNDQLVNLLLDNGADINALSRLFCRCAVPPNRRVAPLWTPLHTAMCHGHESTTKLLLSRGASTNVTTLSRGTDQRRFTALHSACTVDLLDAVRALLDGGHQTDISVRDRKNLTPLAYAFFMGNWAMIDFLIEQGADINAKIGPFSALGHACLMGFYAEALRLLDLGATLQSKSDNGEKPHIIFHLAAVAGAPYFASYRAFKQKEFRLELVNRLIKLGISVNHQGLNGTTTLVGAASFHRVDVVKALLHSGANVRGGTKGSWRICALEMAVMLYPDESQTPPKGAMLNTVRTLLEAMAKSPARRRVDIHIDDVDISKAISRICSLSLQHEDKLEVVALLLRYDRSVEIANVEQDLVFTTMLAENFDITTLLLEKGVNRPCEEQFECAIEDYIDNDCAEGLLYILNRFPDIAPRIRSDQVLRDAVDAGSVECTKLLINEGVSINCRNEDGSSLLFAACIAGDTQTAELLLKNGADPNECTQDGDSLTTVAALDSNRAMIRLLLDFGAKVHSSPPGTLMRHNLGFLDIAISCGLIDAVNEIVAHKDYPEPTDEEISRHWQTIIHAPNSPAYLGLMLDTLIGTGKFDKDQIFTLTNIESGPMITTPLHLCAAVSLFLDRFEIIEELINHGADIHKLLPAKPDVETHLESKFKPKGEVGFEGTTPLEWAIEFSSIRVVRALLEVEVSMYGQLLGPEMEMAEATRSDLMLLYAKAACRRQKPKMFSFLFKRGLDHAICDENGNTIVHMICDYVETFWPNDEPEWTMEFIAERSAFCLIACLKWGVTYLLKNKNGLSGMDRVLQILKYSGDCEFHQTLAKHWRGRLEYVEDPSPRLLSKFAAFDDSDEEEPLFDEEANGNVSDDEPSDGGLGPDDEMSNGEPELNG